MATWIGIDPGQRWTGVTARDGKALLGWRVVDRTVVEPGATRPGVATMDAVVLAVTQLAGGADVLVAVEDTVAPNPHVTRRDGSSLTQVQPLLDAAMVVGYLLAAFPAAVVIRPGRHGSQPLATYPRGLVSDRERAHAVRHRTLLATAPQSSMLRHARSAWDVAGAGAVEARLNHASQSARSR